MSNIGGSIESVSLAGRYFAVPADADTQRKIGGYENASEANGDLSSRLIKTATSPSITGLVVAIDDARADQEYLQELSDLNDYFVVSVTYASGSVWSGRMQISGELQFNNQAATCSFDLMGTGRLSQQ